MTLTLKPEMMSFGCLYPNDSAQTAVLLGCALRMGALVGNATTVAADCLYEFGVNLGIAFQLQDDLLDAFGDPKPLEKK